MASENVVQLKTELHKRVLAKVRLQAGGNSHRTLRDVCVDLINAANEDRQKIADGCFLCLQTIENLGNDITKAPHPDTMNRILNYFGMEINLNPVDIKPEFSNKKKKLKKKK